MEKRNQTILVILMALLSFTASVGILGIAVSVSQTNKTMRNSGSINGIGAGIYWDPACTNQTTSMNWGALDPGANKVVTLYIKNEGNLPATLSKTVQNWNPSIASNFITINWSYAGQVLDVNQAIRVTFSLNVSSTISGINSFSFDLTITATG